MACHFLIYNIIYYFAFHFCACLFLFNFNGPYMCSLSALILFVNSPCLQRIIYCMLTVTTLCLKVCTSWCGHVGFLSFICYYRSVIFVICLYYINIDFLCILCADSVFVILIRSKYDAVLLCVCIDCVCYRIVSFYVRLSHAHVSD